MRVLRIALDATYSVGKELSGVGVYSRQILFGLARRHPEIDFQFCYRSHRFLRSLLDTLPSNASRALLRDEQGPPNCALFHGLNQRLPVARRRVPMVCTFHDLFVLTGDYSTPEFRARFAGQARIAADRADRIIAVSQFTAMQIQHLLGVEIDRLRVVPHGVLQPNPPVGVEREKLVLHVGAVQVRKNIARLVDAFQEMPTDWRFVLAGSSGYGAEEIAKKIEGSPARDRIELRGYVPLLELENLYARASIFAFPSLDEGFGMPVLDAMARGVPVLTSNRSALPEVAGGAALLVDPLDRDEIAAALLRLASDERLRTRLTEEGYTRAALFSWTASVEKTAAVYRELLET